MKLNLFDIALELRRLAEPVEGDEGRTSEEAFEQIRGLSMAADDKIRGLVGLYRERQAEAGAIGDQAKRLRDLAQAKEREADRIKDWLKLFMQTAGVRKQTTDLGEVRVQKSPTRMVPTLAPEDLPEEYQKWSCEPNRAAALDHYRRMGEPPAGFKAEQDEHVRIV